MSIIKHVTLEKIVAHDFRYDPRRKEKRMPLKAIPNSRDSALLEKELVCPPICLTLLHHDYILPSNVSDHCLWVLCMTSKRLYLGFNVASTC